MGISNLREVGGLTFLGREYSRKGLAPTCPLVQVSNQTVPPLGPSTRRQEMEFLGHAYAAAPGEKGVEVTGLGIEGVSFPALMAAVHGTVMPNALTHPYPKPTILHQRPVDHFNSLLQSTYWRFVGNREIS